MQSRVIQILASLFVSLIRPKEIKNLIDISGHFQASPFTAVWLSATLGHIRAGVQHVRLVLLFCTLLTCTCTSDKLNLYMWNNSDLLCLSQQPFSIGD